MSDGRDQREFDAGLRADVEAWLQGDRSRRSFLEHLALLGGAAALGRAGIGPALAADGTVEMAAPDTPLGQAQAAALEASTKGPVDGSAYRAVEAAKKLTGVTLNMTYEAGLQAL